MSTENQNEEMMKEEEATQAVNETNETATQDTPQEETGQATAEEPAANALAVALKTLEEQKDKYLRLSAEFDNYRKRTMKEKAELIKNGGEKTINAILPILDDFERALQNMKGAENTEAIYQGVELIAQKFQKVLSQEGLQKMEPVGEAFNTDFHEAVALVPAQEESQKGKVLDCVQTGYLLNEKVIRHAKVVVAQ